MFLKSYNDGESTGENKLAGFLLFFYHISSVRLIMSLDWFHLVISFNAIPILVGYLKQKCPVYMICKPIFYY